MFTQFFEVFWPKMVEYVAEQGHNNIKDFEHVLETLRKNLQLLSAKASDIQVEIKNAELSGRKKRKRQVKEWLEQVESIEKEVDELGSRVESQGSIIMRYMDGGKAARLNEQVEKLLQHSRDFRELVIDARWSRGETLLTDELVGEAFKENLERILKLLEDKEVSKIGVYGMGGAGKTTLAKHVYNRLVQQSQERVFWITVSQEFCSDLMENKNGGVEGKSMKEEDVAGDGAEQRKKKLKK